MKLVTRLFSLAALVATCGLATAQTGWGDSCIDPENTTPRTPDHFANYIQNAFIIHAVGVSGSVTYGGENGPCYSPAKTLDLSGRLGFMIGSVGSVQSSFDNFMALTTGMPVDPAGDFCYARIIRGPAAGTLDTALFGDGGVGSYVPMSGRSIITTWQDGETQVVLTSRVIGDAVRLHWKMTNLAADAQRLGLKFGAYMGMRSNGADQFGHTQAGSLLPSGAVPKPTAIPGAEGDISRNGYVSFIETDTTKPIHTGKNWLRSNPRFPSRVSFQWGQWNPYGIRIDNDPTDATPDQTSASQMLVGTHQGTAGILSGNNMPGRLFNDNNVPGGDPALVAGITNVLEDSDTPISEASFIQVFPAQIVAAGQFREVVQYIRSPWSVGDYRDPYTALVDAPRLVEPSPGGLNDLSPNPMTIAAYVDNQYATTDQSISLSDVRYTISFPTGSGLSLAPGEQASKTIPSIAPNGIGSVTWQVQANGEVVGDQPYTVTIVPGNSRSTTLSGNVLVSGTPRVRLPEGAVLVTFPWNFADSSLDAIFGGGLQFGVDYLAYRWDPITLQYLPQVTARRGESVWIVCLNDNAFQQLNGATVPTDINLGGLTTTLQAGWNMIGNPYPYAVRLSTLIAVGLADPGSTLTWDQLVSNGWVSPALAYWERDPLDPDSGFYRFTEGNTDFLQPGRGYWIYVVTPQRIQITWPPVLAAGASGTTRRPGETTNSSVWRQNERQWRLQMVARTNDGIDSQNFIGVTTSMANARKLRRFDPPVAPKSKVDLSISEMVDGKESRLAASFAQAATRRTWKLVAKAETAGEVILTWPNITTVPRNMRLTLKDVATNTTRDLRFQNSYSYTVDEPTVREFVLTMEPAGTARAIIGNVTVSRPGRDANSPVVINYTLSAEAMTTIKIMNNGKEVYSFHRGRSDIAGQNQVSWNLRDSANRAVAPGTYQVEIRAETSNGEVVRKIVPVNVVR